MGSKKVDPLYIKSLFCFGIKFPGTARQPLLAVEKEVILNLERSLSPAAYFSNAETQFECGISF